MNKIKRSSRAPQGARGLKYPPDNGARYQPCGRAPQGARGLKWLSMGYAEALALVAPRKGRVD